METKKILIFTAKVYYKNILIAEMGNVRVIIKKNGIIYAPFQIEPRCEVYGYAIYDLFELYDITENTKVYIEFNHKEVCLEGYFFMKRSLKIFNKIYCELNGALTIK